jgi:hypothetical protein
VRVPPLFEGTPRAVPDTERILRTINNIVRFLLFQASLPPAYWADTLHTATYLLNRHPTKTLAARTPYLALHGTPHPMIVYACSDALVILTCYPPPPISSRPAPLYVSSLVTPRIIKVIGVLIFTLIGSLCPDMLCSMVVLSLHRHVHVSG